MPASFSVLQPMVSMKAELPLTPHCALSLQHSARSLEKMAAEYTYMIYHHSTRPDTGFLCPYEISIWLLPVKLPSTTAET